MSERSDSAAKRSKTSDVDESEDSEYDARFATIDKAHESLRNGLVPEIGEGNLPHPSGNISDQYMNKLRNN